MVFQVPPSKASIGQDKFEFEIDGKKFSVKKFNCLTLADQVFMQSDEATSEQVLDLVWGTKTSSVGKAVRALEDNQFDALRDAWVADSEVTPGESGGSST